MSRNKVVGNAVWIIGGKIMQSLLGLFVSTISARYLGPSNFGLISYASSVVAFVMPIMTLGIDNVLVQETIQYPEEEGKISGTSIFLCMLSSVFCVLGVICFVCFVNAGEKDTIIVCLLYSAILFAQAVELMQYWFQAKYLSKYASIVSLIAYLCVSFYKIYLLITEKNIYWFAVSNAIDYLLIGIILIFVYRRLGGQRFGVSRLVAKRLLSKGGHYIIPAMMVTVFAQTDKIMLKLMIGNDDTGCYSVAVTCASLTSFVFAAIINSMRPAIFENQKVSLVAFENSVSKLYTVIIYLSLAQCVAMTIFARPIISILYGDEFIRAASTLQIIVWYTTFSYIGSVRNIWILANNEQRHLWKINLFGAVANVVLNAFMIPVWGILGAAVASLITQIFTNVIVGWMLAPIRQNNAIMMKSLNPRELLIIFRILLKK